MECLDDREIDDLILGRIPGDDAQRCLAHLLWCGQCQARVEEEREFAIAIRAAANILEKETLATRNGAAVAGWGQRLAEWLGAPFSTRWVVVAASACVMLALGIYAPLRYAGPGAAEVLLHSERGVATPATVEASVSGHLRLLIDVTDVVPSASYSAILVDADGRELEKQTVAPSGGIVSLPVGRSLAPARYWIRLSTPDGPLLREYALLVR